MGRVLWCTKSTNSLSIFGNRFSYDPVTLYADIILIQNPQVFQLARRGLAPSQYAQLSLLFPYYLGMSFRSNTESTASLSSKIIAHRGSWMGEDRDEFAPNSWEAITRAAEFGFGLETDIRDIGLDIFIAHDPFQHETIQLSTLVDIKFLGPLCLNVKSDGLASKLKNLKFISEVFYFDMSVPELYKYLNYDLNAASRLSEFENQIFLGADYLWVDGFSSDWWASEDKMQSIMKTDKRVIFVSPELHQRPYQKTWAFLGAYMIKSENIFICTDRPFELLEYLESL